MYESGSILSAGGKDFKELPYIYLPSKLCIKQPNSGSAVKPWILADS